MAKEKQQEAVPQEPVKQEAYDPMKDLISVALPRATGNEQNFELVGLNGKVWKIMKGTTVRIPRPVYEILANSWRMEDRLRVFNEEQAAKANPG